MSSRIRKYWFIAVPILCLVLAMSMMAQIKTTTTQVPGKVSHEATVERGEVVYVAGNDLVVKMESGEIRHFTVPDGATAMVNGKAMTLTDLKPGMKLERTITSTTQEQTVKTVKTGTGKVINIVPPLSITLQFEDGSVQQFKIPKDQVFMVDGQKMTSFQIKKGMKITATRISEEPATIVSKASQVTGSAPPPPETPPQEGVLLIAQNKPAPAPVAMEKKVAEPAAAPAAAPAEPPAKKLPTTASPVPLIGLLGFLFSGASLAAGWFRRS